MNRWRTLNSSSRLRRCHWSCRSTVSMHQTCNCSDKTSHRIEVKTSLSTRLWSLRHHERTPMSCWIESRSLWRAVKRRLFLQLPNRSMYTSIESEINTYHVDPPLAEQPWCETHRLNARNLEVVLPEASGCFVLLLQIQTDLR